MQARYGTDTIPQTAENLARERGISREDQDAYALRSQQRRPRPRARRGFLAEEIVPVDVVGRGARRSAWRGRAPAAGDDARAAGAR